MCVNIKRNLNILSIEPKIVSGDLLIPTMASCIDGAVPSQMMSLKTLNEFRTPRNVSNFVFFEFTLFESPASVKTARPSTNSSTHLQLDERICALLNLLVLADVLICRLSLS